MIPEMSERSTKLRARVQEFMDEHIMPNEALYYQHLLPKTYKKTKVE